MKEIKLTIQINKPVSDVFVFTLDPKNTPLYVNSILEEETNEWPVKLGTIYRNRRDNSEWSEYEVIEFKENETFTLQKKDGSLLVRYAFKPIRNNKTEFEYYVKSNTEFDEHFIKGIVEKLKTVIEE